mgnify:CR=1 FL=1
MEATALLLETTSAHIVASTRTSYLPSMAQKLLSWNKKERMYVVQVLEALSHRSRLAREWKSCADTSRQAWVNKKKNWTKPRRHGCNRWQVRIENKTKFVLRKGQHERTVQEAIFPYILSLREPEFNIMYQHRTNIWETILDGTNINYLDTKSNMK